MNQMTKEEFICKIETQQQKAADLMEGNGGYNIVRGMAHVISGYAEDLFALYVAENVQDSTLQYCVDKVISIRLPSEQKAKSFKPDLSVIRENTLCCYFDLKTNMGWNRDFEHYLKEKSDFIESIKGQQAWINWGNDPIQHIEISKDLRYQMVIIFGWNINQELLRATLDRAKNFSNIKVHVLIHKEEGAEHFAINDLAFDEILNSVNP